MEYITWFVKTKKKKKKKRENEIRVVEIFDQHTPWGAIQARLYLIIEWKHRKKKIFFFVDVFCVRPCVFLVKVQSTLRWWSGEVLIYTAGSVGRARGMAWKV